ncbi:MAG: hypothetical protein RBT33_01355 [Candidatus Dojkabacteria bacterium]|jgi:hypothetical protein|nr:hypothetical protein [Candidatus Dojkabacteria bacterium]
MIKGGEDFFKDKNDDYSSNSGGSFRGIPSSRIPMIEQIYELILGRKPSSRENAYYKYSPLSEDEIRIKLLESQEHKDIIEDAQRIKGVENELRSSQINEKKLAQQVVDLGKQIDESQMLLNERNNIIIELREQLQNPYNLPSQIQKYEEGFDVYGTVRAKERNEIEKKSVMDILKNIFNMIVK